MALIGLARGFGSDNFGQLSLLLSWASLLRLFMLNWLLKVIARFSAKHPSHTQAVDQLVGAVHHVFAGLVVLILVAACTVNGDLFIYVLIGLSALADSVRDSALERFRAHDLAAQYGRASILWMTCIAVVSWLVPLIGLSVEYYLLIHATLSLILFPRLILVTPSIQVIAPRFREYLTFSFPLALSDGVAHVSYVLLRFLIGYGLSTHALGVFSAVYEFVQRIIVGTMQVIASSTHPALRRAHDNQDVLARRGWIDLNFHLMLFSGATIVLVLACFGAEISELIQLDLVAPHLLFLIVGTTCAANRLRVLHVEIILQLEGHGVNVLKNSILHLIGTAVISALALSYPYLLLICICNMVVHLACLWAAFRVSSRSFMSHSSCVWFLCSAIVALGLLGLSIKMSLFFRLCCSIVIALLLLQSAVTPISESIHATGRRREM